MISRCTRQEVQQRDKDTCQRCGDIGHTQIHHLIPEFVNGSDEITNLTTLCTTCHTKAHIAMGFGPSATKHHKGCNQDCRIQLDIPDETDKKIWLYLEKNGIGISYKSRLFLYAIDRMLKDPLPDDFKEQCQHAKDAIRERQKKRYQEKMR